MTRIPESNFESFMVLTDETRRARKALFSSSPTESFAQMKQRYAESAQWWFKRGRTNEASLCREMYFDLIMLESMAGEK